MTSDKEAFFLGYFIGLLLGALMAFAFVCPSHVQLESAYQKGRDDSAKDIENASRIAGSNVRITTTQPQEPRP